MGAMYIIHASITEYIIIFGTAVGTEGHSGRHTADNYFNIIYGTQLAYTPGTYVPEVYPQGSINHTKRGTVKQYKMDEACFALEYSRGWMPPMLFFGFADGKSNSLYLSFYFGECCRTGLTWRRVHVHTGYSDSLEDSLDYGTGDVGQSRHREIIVVVTADETERQIWG